MLLAWWEEWSQSSPFVLTFRTGSADSAGRRYVQAGISEIQSVDVG